EDLGRPLLLSEEIPTADAAEAAAHLPRGAVPVEPPLFYEPEISKPCGCRVNEAAARLAAHGAVAGDHVPQGPPDLVPHRPAKPAAGHGSRAHPPLLPTRSNPARRPSASP